MQNSICFWDKLGHLEKWLFFATEDSVKVRIQVVVSSFFIEAIILWQKPNPSTVEQLNLILP